MINQNSKFYITTSIPYINSNPHLGIALEYIQADVIARYHRKLGAEVWFLTGSDEHGGKIAKAAQDLGQEPQEFVDNLVEEFKKLLVDLNISNDDFIRTTDQNCHWPSVEKIWKRLAESDDLYKANYKGLYCVGHEAFIKKSELTKEGLCPDHQVEPEIIEEENYFFRLTKYRDQIRKLIESGELKILPEYRANEILEILKDSEDISFSRPRKDLAWGVPVPDDPTSTVYVWSEALINYISALDYANNSEKFKKYWPADIHLIGKDILRFHAIYWPAMLLSAGLELPKSIYVHGFITVDGQKMSKSLGNVIDPFDLIKDYGADAVRYYLLREISSYEDGDFSLDKFKARYNGDLANNLGNLVSRVQKLVNDYFEGGIIVDESKIRDDVKKEVVETEKRYKESIENFKLHEALASIFQLCSFANQFIDFHKPWTLIEGNPQHLNEVMENAVFLILKIAGYLEVFLPDTSQKILDSFQKGKNSGILFPKR